MENCLDEEVGQKRFNSLDFFVHETDSFKYCALLNEIKTNEKGKKSVIRYTELDVKNFCNSIERFSEENFHEMISYAHDVQYMIGKLVHRSIVNDRNKDDIVQLRQALTEINVLAAILSAKDCFFRYRTNSYPSFKISLSPTGKFFKIYKAYQQFNLVKEKKITFLFNSENTSNIDTYEIFDFIPYILIENAVKYSPRGSEIDIDITNIRDKIQVVVGSFGPALSDEEKDLIFTKRYRGETARLMGIKGQGLGLYHLRQALSEMKIGTIKVTQRNSDSPLLMDGHLHCYTEFK